MNSICGKPISEHEAGQETDGCWRYVSAVIAAQRDTLSGLRVENQRLRDALKKIALYSRPVKEDGREDGRDDAAWCAWYAARTAFDALRTEQEDE